MKKLIVQRKIEVWIEDIYNVEEINDDIIQDAINYNLDVIDNSEVLWETQIELGPVEVFDDDYEKLYSNIIEDE